MKRFMDMQERDELYNERYAGVFKNVDAWRQRDFSD